MKNAMFKTSFFFFSLLLILSAGLSSCEEDKAGIFFGDNAHLGKGHARAFIELDEAGEVLNLGVTVDKSAIEGLNDPNNHHHNMVAVEMPAEAKKIGFDHIGLDWNPQGHEPAGVYDKPHFDVHFNYISVKDRMAIPPYEVDSSKFNKLPASAYFPANYIRIPGGVPQMGAHWIDVTGEELQGKPFRHTFIYGSYNGKVIFVEPMITLAALQSATREVSVTVPLPAKSEIGYKVGRYTYQYDAKAEQYKITMRDLSRQK
jgi:Domain of unknown function (DUF5602)